MKNQILTKAAYWNSISASVKSMWQNTADAKKGVLVCTHRPDVRTYRGNTKVRRCSTGGKWGKSADVVSLSLDALMAHGYILVSYETPAEVSTRIDAARDAVYSAGQF